MESNSSSQLNANSGFYHGDPRFFRYISPALVLCIGIALSVVLFISARHMEDARIKAGFEGQAKNRFIAFKNIMSSYIQELKALEALFAASEKVTRAEFQVFSKRLLSHYERTQALEWVPRVPDSGRDAYEAEARREGLKDFQITEKNAQDVMVKADRRGEYFPIYFIEPYKGNEEGLGYDLSSEPIRLAALRLARDTGEVTATAGIKLLQGKGKRDGVLICYPVFRTGLPADSIEDRRRNLEGFVLGAFMEGDLLEEAIFSFVPEGIDVYLYDNSAPPNDNFLYFHSTRSRAPQASPAADVNELTKGLHYSETIDVGGRKWLALFIPAPDYISSNKTWNAWWLLAGGVLFTGLLAGYMSLVTGQTVQARRHSAELFRAKEELSRTHHTLSAFLNNIPDLAWVKDPEGRFVIVNEAFSRACGVPIDALPGKTDFDIWPLELAEKYIANDRRVMAIGQQQQVEEPYVDTEGRPHFIETIKTPFKNNKGTIIGTVGIARDITERKKAEEEIIRAKEEWEKTFDTIPDIVIVIDNEYRIIRANKALAEKLGITKEELTGKSCYKLLHNTDGPPEHCPHHKAVTTAEKHIEEFYSESLKGYYIMSATPLYDSEGWVFGIVEIGHDISDRKRAEEKLKVISAYNRSLIEAGLDPLVTIAADGKITDVNTATENITGYSREELIGTDFSDYFTDPENARAGYQQVFRDGTVHDYPLDIRHRKGQVTSVLYNASVYRDERGQIAGVFAAARDITELKRAERAMRLLGSIVEYSNDAIIGKDLEGIITSWNKGAEIIFGFNEAEAVGRPVTMLIPEDRKDEEQQILEKIGRGELIKHFETMRKRKDGSLISVSLTISPIKDIEERITGASTIARDITERKMMEVQISASLEEKEVLLREIHHRVKNNMTIIYSLLDLQSKFTLEQYDREMFNDAKARIKTMALIHEKLYRSGDMAKIDFSDYLRDILNDMYRSYVKDPGMVALNVDVRDVSLGIDDAIPCGLIINELVSNTLKHAFPAGRKGEVRVGMRQYYEDMVELIVADNGIGCPDDLDARKKASLGLNLIDALVKQLQGEIEFRKEDGTGFRITFRKRK